MRRRNLTSAAIATAIAATMLAVAPAASAAPAPKALTHKYPLGTQTLCCHSQSATTPVNDAAPSGPAPPAQSTQHQRPTPPPAHHHGHIRLWMLAGVVAAALAFLLLDWLALRRSRRVPPRPRREVPPIALFLLKPIYRYDVDRDAWILRVRGDRYGPVLRPSGYIAAEPDEDASWPTADIPLKLEPPPLAIRPRRH
jgi:hypothetical protein